MPTLSHHRYSASQAGPSAGARRARPSAVRSGSACTVATTSGDAAAATGTGKCAHATRLSSPSFTSTGEQCSSP